jgi:hypothetical protein
MENYKIDIFLELNFLVIQNLNTQEQKYFTISDLSGDLLTSYNNFNQLINQKTNEDFNQIYVAKNPVIRFVTMKVHITKLENTQETLYDNLSDSEKLIFDNFYNTFTN